MTIPANNRNNAVGNDSTDTYEYGFKIFAATHLEVKVKRASDGSVTTLAYPTHYAVTNVGRANGGNVVLESVGGAWQNTDGTLKTGYSISILRNVPIVQATDIKNQGDFFAATHEDAFDYQMMVNQAQADSISRSVRLDSAYDPDAFDMTLPAPVASGAIGFNSTADGLAIISDLSGAPTTAFTLTLLDDANADTFWATLASGMTDWDAVWADIVDGIIDLDVAVQKLFDGMTVETAPAAGDLMIISDISVTPDEARAITLSDMLEVVADLTENTDPDRDNDYFLQWDASAAAGSRAKKVPFKASKITTLVRQTVLMSALTSAGYANAITTGSGLRPGLSATTTPIVMAFANGYDAYGAVDYCERISADASDILGADLPTSNTSYLYRTMGSAWGSCLVPPQYGYSFDKTENTLLNMEQVGTPTCDFGNTYSANGGVATSVTKPAFGTRSLDLSGGVAGATNAKCLVNTSWQGFGGDSWEMTCVAFHDILPSSPNTHHPFWAGPAGAQYGVTCGMFNNAGTIRFAVWLSSNGTSWDIASATVGTTTPVVNTWYRYRLVFDALAGTYRLYISNGGTGATPTWGAEVQDISISSTARIAQCTRLQWGAFWGGAAVNNGMSGYLDACRVIRAATATAAVTPATSALAITDFPVHFFSIPEMKMYEVTAASASAGTNPTMTQRNRLFVAEADTSGAAVTVVRNYALRGEYDSGWFDVALSTTYEKNHLIGVAPKEIDLWFKPLLGHESEYRVTPLMYQSTLPANFSDGAVVFRSSKKVTVRTGNEYLTYHTSFFTNVDNAGGKPTGSYRINASRGW